MAGPKLDQHRRARRQHGCQPIGEADGVPEVRRAAREEIKAGARYVKIMANGGIASPTDPIEFFGYSREEIAAVVELACFAGPAVHGAVLPASGGFRL